MTLVPPVLVLLDKDGEIEVIHHLTPLWVFAKEFVGSKMADSIFDPVNKDVKAFNELKKSQRGALRFSLHPPSVPAPSHFPRMVAASGSGNVNSTIIFNYFQKTVLPEIRGHGVTVNEQGVVLTDRHGSHEGKEFLTDLEEKQNAIPVFGPPHATDRVQLQDARDGQFQKLKSQSKKDTVLWHKAMTDMGLKLVAEADAPFVFQNAYIKSCQEKVTRLGLKNIGLLPRDPDRVLKKMGTKTYAEFVAEFGKRWDDEDKKRTAAIELEEEGEEEEEEEKKEDEEKEKEEKASPCVDMFYQLASQPPPQCSLSVCRRKS